MSAFPHLFSPITTGGFEIPNRIVWTGHHTYPADGAPSPELIAHHKARAKGRAGLIVTEVIAVHDSAGFSSQLWSAHPDGLSAYSDLAFGAPLVVSAKRRVIVVGGGPADMKAAAVAAARGHDVRLFERTPRLGGQALLSQLPAGREEFGGIIDNLSKEMASAGVKVFTGQHVSDGSMNSEIPDVAISAIGATPFTPGLGISEAHLLTAWDVLNGANTGKRVVIADWKALASPRSSRYRARR